MPDTVLRAAAKTGIAWANRPWAERRMRRVLRETEPPYRVYVGSGRVRLPGWLATDIGHHAHLYLDATEPWPFPDGSVSHVYSDNMIEHVPIAGARRMLVHAKRAMAPGARLRISTPDVERTARIYLEGASLARACMSENRDAFGYDVHHPVDLLRNTFVEHGHHRGYLYDLASLSTELERAGFVDVRRWESGESDDPVLSEVEVRTSPTVAARALVVEARKPRS